MDGSCAGDVAERQDDVGVTDASGEDTAEKIARVHQKLAEKRAEREEKEKEDLLEKELRRREHGKAIIELKRKKEEDEARKIAEELRREKAADSRAREEVLRKIAEDRAAREAEEADRKRRAAGITDDPALSRQDHVPVPTRGKAPDSAQIVFKLPSGATLRGEFKATDTVSALFKHVMENYSGGPLGPFVLRSNVPPRCTFAPGDTSATLSQLQLCPSAILIVQPIAAGAALRGPSAQSKLSSSSGSAVSSPTDGGFIARIFALFAYIFALLNPFAHFGGGSGATHASRLGGAPGDGSRAGAGSNAADNRQSGRPIPQQRSGDTNIHRLRHNDDEEKRATYNGNSTQQE
eukprot:Opistho-2@10068